MADINLPIVLRYGTIAEWDAYDFDPKEFCVVVDDDDEPTGGIVIGTAVGGVGNYVLFNFDDGGGGGTAAWGSITGALGDQSDLNSALADKAPLDSPVFTGTPEVPTAAPGTDDEQVASTAYVVAAVAAGGGAGSNAYGAVRGVTATGNITNTDAGDLVVFSGSTASQTLTLVRTSWTAQQWVDILITASVPVTVSAGTDGINAAGNDSVVAYPGQLLRFVYEGTADPYWRAPIATTLALTANQHASVDSTGTVQEGRTDKIALIGFVATTEDGTFQLGPWPFVPSEGVNVVSSADGGACSVKYTKNGSDIDGFSSAVAITTSNTTTTSTETYANGDKMRMVVSDAAAGSLTGGVWYAINGNRTDD